MSVGVYGKLPAQGDFLRAGGAEFARLGLDRWFAEGVEAIAAGGRALSAEPVGFLLAPPEARVAFLGVFVPSEDAVGRAFPLAIFLPLDGDRLGESFPLLPTAHAVFLAAATELLGRASGMTGDELVAAAGALPNPTFHQGDAAMLLSRAPAGELASALGGLREGGPYAFRTLLVACEQARKAPPPAGATITVDGAAPDDATRLFWLELVRRRLAWREGVPSFLWTARRLLVALGAPPPAMLAFVANPGHRSQRFWPLRTEVRAASDQAMGALGPEQRRALEGGAATLLDLALAFGR